MTEFNLRPPRDLVYAQSYNERWGDFAIHRFVRKIETVGLENLAGLPRDRPYVYLGNHQTVGDLFNPYRVILSNGLPMPRTVAKKSLRRVKPIFNFEKFGVIWLDRNAKGSAALEEFTSLVAQGFRENESSWFFLEGTRSKTVDQEPKEFKAGSCGVILNAAEMAQVKPGVICTASRYEAIPEGCFDSPDFEFVRRVLPAKYIPAAEMLYWMFWERNKGTVRIAFSHPYELEELAGEGRGSVRRKRMAERTHDIISEMWRGLGSHNQ